MSQANVSRSKAVKALRNNSNDIVNAIMVCIFASIQYWNILDFRELPSFYLFWTIIMKHFGNFDFSNLTDFFLFVSCRSWPCSSSFLPCFVLPCFICISQILKTTKNQSVNIVHISVKLEGSFHNFSNCIMSQENCNPISYSCMIYTWFTHGKEARLRRNVEVLRLSLPLLKFKKKIFYNKNCFIFVIHWG